MTDKRFLAKKGLDVNGQGIDSSGTNPLTLAIAGTELVWLTSAGNVGYGIASIALDNNRRGLHVHNPAAAQGTQIRLTSANTGATATDGSIIDVGTNGVLSLWNCEAAALAFATSNTERARFDASGNFGLGITAPLHKLDVAWDANSAQRVRLRNANAGAAAVTMLHIANDIDYAFQLQVASSTAAEPNLATIQMNAGPMNFNAGGQNHIRFTTNSQERVRIDSNGTVSIGTAGNNPNNRFLFVRSGIGLSFNGTTEAGKWYHDGTLGYLDAGAGGQVFYTGNGERMRIDSTGNVGIGNTAPGSKLDVTGLARAAAFGMNATGGTVSTGMAAPAADTLAWYTNTTERVRIDADGNVGIGTSAPATFGKFVTRINTNQNVYIKNNNAVSEIGSTNDAATAINDLAFTGYSIRFNAMTAGAEVARFDQSGNFALGTTAATFASAYKGAHIHNATASQGSQLHLSNAGTGATSSDGASITCDAAGRMGVWNHESSVIMFATNNTERMQLDANGNLSLGFNTGAVGKFAIAPGQNGINGVGGDAKLIVDALLGVTNDAAAAYVLISPKYVNGTVAAAGFDGTISAYRGNATTNHRTQKVEVSFRVAYNSAVLGKLDGDFRLVELTYNSNPWIAIELPSDSSRDIYVQGRFWGAAPQLVQAANVTGVASYSERSAFVAGGASAAIVVAGSERLRIDANGWVGIGTATPARGLHLAGVAGSAIPSVRLERTSVRTWSLETANAGNFNILDNTNAVTRLVIDANGNVSNGIDTPAYSYHAYRASGSTTIAAHNNGSTAGNFAQFYALTQSGAWSFGTEAGNGRFFVYNNTAAADQLIFSGGATSSVTISALGAAAIVLNSNSLERARIDLNGNFGVGTAGPTNYAGYRSMALNGTDGGILEFMSNGVHAARITGWSNTFAVHTSNTERLRIDSSGSIMSTGGGPIGYGGGSGGTVTQVTSRTTGVTINKPSGAITLVSAAGATAWTSFTVTNSVVQINDTIRVCQRSGTNKYQTHVTAVGNGSFEITFNTTGGTTVEAPVFNFTVTRGSVA